MFPELEVKFQTINQITAKFNELVSGLFQPGNDPAEKEHYEKQEDHNAKKQMALEELDNCFESQDLDFLLPLAPVDKYCADHGLTGLNIDDAYLAYFKLLLKG